MPKVLKIERYTLRDCMPCPYVEWAIKNICELLKDDYTIMYITTTYDDNIKDFEELPQIHLTVGDGTKNIIKGMPDLVELQKNVFEIEHNTCGKGYFKYMDAATQLIELYILAVFCQMTADEKAINRLQDINDFLVEKKYVISI